jgi:hypothetical protein
MLLRATELRYGVRWCLCYVCCECMCVCVCVCCEWVCALKRLRATLEQQQRSMHTSDPIETKHRCACFPSNTRKLYVASLPARPTTVPAQHPGNSGRQHVPTMTHPIDPDDFGSHDIVASLSLYSACSCAVKMNACSPAAAGGAAAAGLAAAAVAAAAFFAA